MDALLQEAFSLKQAIDTQTDRLREINRQLAESADFNDKKSATINGQHVKAKISLRENVKWDQDKLIHVRDHFNHFEDAFKAEWKPVSAKALEVACVNPEFARAVDWCRTVTPGAPSVTYELIEQEVADAA